MFVLLKTELVQKARTDQAIKAMVFTFVTELLSLSLPLSPGLYQPLVFIF